MMHKFSVWFAHRRRFYAELTLVAESEADARAIAEKHLADRKPFGFSEREIRSINPERTPWVPGITILGVYKTGPDVEEQGLDDIPF